MVEAMSRSARGSEMSRGRWPTLIACSVLMGAALFSTLFTAVPGAYADGASQYSGVVVDASGTPVPGLSLELVDASGNPYSTTTGSDGSFSFVVNSGQYTLEIDRQTGPSGAPNNETITANVDLSTSETGQTLTLPALSTVNVVVSNAVGSPIEGATLILNTTTLSCSSTFTLTPGLSATDEFEVGGAGREGGLNDLTTDATGTASFQVLPCATFAFTGNAFAPGYTAIIDTTFSVDGPTTIPITLYMPGQLNSTFSGVLQDSAGNPLAGVTMTLYSPTVSFPGPPNRYSVTTDANGAYSFSVTALANYSLTLSGVGAGPGASSFNLYVPTVNLTTSLANQTMTVPLNPFAVAVSDSNGDPVVGAVISPNMECQGVPAIELLPGITTTADSFSGNNTQGDYSILDTSLTTDNTGTATFDALPCDNNVGTVHIQPSSGTGLAEEYVTPPSSWSGSTTFPVVVSSLQGILVDSNNDPLSAQTVQIESGSGTTIAQGDTSAGGNFALTAPPGTYSVALSGSVGDPTTYSATVSNVDLSSGQNGTTTIPTVLVAVNVTGLNDVALADAIVSVPATPISFPAFGGVAVGTETATETTNSSGSVTLELLSTNSTTLTITPPGGSGLAPTTVTIEPSNGQVVDVSLTAALAPTSVKIAGPTSVTVGSNYSASASAPGAVPLATFSLAAGAPNWLAINATSGVVSGVVPEGVRSFSFAVIATNTQGHARSVAERVTVLPGTTSVVITPTPGSPLRVGTSATYEATVDQTSGSGALTGKITFSENNKSVPGCVNVLLLDDSASCTVRFISSGVYTMNATYGADSNFAGSSVTWEQVVGQAPVFTSPTTVTATVGKSVNFEVVTTGSPSSTISEKGSLPKGLNFVPGSNGTATISGTPAAGTGASYALTFTASNVVGSVTQIFTLVVVKP